MGEAQRRDEYREELGERLKRLQQDEAAAQRVPVNPEFQRVAQMEPGARQAIFNIDLLTVLIGGMANQLGLAGRPDLAQPFGGFIQALGQLRAQMMQREAGAGLVIAQPGDVPRPG